MKRKFPTSQATLQKFCSTPQELTDVVSSKKKDPPSLFLEAARLSGVYDTPPPPRDLSSQQEELTVGDIDGSWSPNVCALLESPALQIASGGDSLDVPTISLPDPVFDNGLTKEPDQNSMKTIRCDPTLCDTLAWIEFKDFYFTLCTRTVSYDEIDECLRHFRKNFMNLTSYNLWPSLEESASQRILPYRNFLSLCFRIWNEHSLEKCSKIGRLLTMIEQHNPKPELIFVITSSLASSRALENQVSSSTQLVTQVWDTREDLLQLGVVGEKIPMLITDWVSLFSSERTTRLLSNQKGLVWMCVFGYSSLDQNTDFCDLSCQSFSVREMTILTTLSSTIQLSSVSTKVLQYHFVYRSDLPLHIGNEKYVDLNPDTHRICYRILN